MWVFQRVILSCLLVVGVGCTSTGSVGMITKGSVNPAIVLHEAQGFHEIGLVKSRACRHLIVGIVPVGDSSLETAVNRALGSSGGDALINVTVSSSLYGFVPVYNVYAFTCTAVQGTAIRFIHERTRHYSSATR